MMLYHGSMQEVSQPDIAFSRKRLDFGRGFYTTPLKQQATDWANRFKRLGKNAVLNHYEFDEAQFKTFHTKEFYSYNEEWLDFILANRLSRPVTDYDMIIGGVANDRVFNRRLCKTACASYFLCCAVLKMLMYYVYTPLFALRAP